MAIDRDGDQSDLELEELFRNLRNTTAGTASITPGSGTNGKNLSFDLLKTNQIYSSQLGSRFSGSYRKNDTKEARIGSNKSNYSTDTVDAIYLVPNRHKGRPNSGTGTPTYVTLPSSNSNINLNAYRMVSESSFIVNDTCGQTLSSNSYRMFGNNTVKGNKFKDINGDDLAAVVFGSSTTHTNQTHTWNLGTVCAAGDIVLLMQVTGGGNARPATSYSLARAKLKNTSGNVTVTANGSSNSSTASQIYPANEYEGGSGYTDTTAAVQRLVATGGENQIQAYFQHSGTIDCTMATVVLKKDTTVKNFMGENIDVLHETAENSSRTHTFGTTEDSPSGAATAIPSGFLSITISNFPQQYFAHTSGHGTADISARTGTSQYAPSRAAIYQRETTYFFDFDFDKDSGETEVYNPDENGVIRYKSGYNTSSLKGGGVTFLFKLAGRG